jgi:hypothetical protein
VTCRGEKSAADSCGRVEIVETLAGGYIEVADGIATGDSGCGGTGEEPEELVIRGRKVESRPRAHPERRWTFWVHCLVVWMHGEQS